MLWTASGGALGAAWQGAVRTQRHSIVGIVTRHDRFINHHPESRRFEAFVGALQVCGLKNASRILSLDFAQVRGQPVHVIAELFGDLVANTADLVDEWIAGGIERSFLGCCHVMSPREGRGSRSAAG